MNLAEVTTYESAVSYCMAVPRFTEKNSMESTKDFLSYLGNPGSRSKVIHIAGTNGKGSVSAFLQSICIKTGQSVGMFTSPHLVTIRERIRLGQEYVSEDDFLDAFLTIKEKLFLYQKKYPEKKNYHPSFFELLFFIAMVYFEKTGPEIILLETGLGGRLDATNSISNPVLCIITKIGYDHMEYLGSTLPEIAGEKAGIIKPGIPVIYWKEKEEVNTVIEETAHKLSSPCTFASKADVDLLFFDDKRIDFSYKSRYYGYVRFSVNTKAVYQTENAALAIAAVTELFRSGAFGAERVSGQDMLRYMQAGVAAMHWEGRMEEVLPHVFFDGAHNEDGIDAFLASVGMDSCEGKRSLLFSVVHDKQYHKMINKIIDSGLFDKVYTAPIASDRSISKEELKEEFAGRISAECFAAPEEAFEEMLTDRETDDYLYVAGSLYLIGQLKGFLGVIK